MRLSPEEIIAALENAERLAIDGSTGELAKERAEALNRYRGAPLGNEVEGRSQVVDRSIMDTIEWIMPSLTRIYQGGDDIGQFEPMGPEDEESAKSETEVCNWYLENKNDAFSQLQATLRDALLLRNGYMVGLWRKRVDTVTETYIGKTEDEATALMQDEGVTLLESTPRPDPVYGQVFDIKLELKKAEEYVQVESVPPDELLVSRRHRLTSLLDCDFVEWVRRNVTIGELRAEGFEIGDDEGSDEAWELESQSRERFDSRIHQDDETNDPSRRVVTFRDAYIRMDLEGKGTQKLWRIARVDGSKKIVLQEEANIIPFAAFSPIVYAHSHIGTSVYDMIADLGMIKTALTRQVLDGVYLQQSGRVGVDVNRVTNLDDLLSARPGGVVRFDGNPAECMMPFTVPDTSSQVLGALEYVESQKEGRTGVTRYSAGLDANTLNKTATGVQAIQAAANQRIELIARTLASGFKDLFLIIHALASKYCTKELRARLGGEWQTVDPRSWKRRTDFRISVGLGTGTPEQQLQKLMALQPLFQAGMQMGLAGPMEAYNFGAEIWKAAGYRVPDRFIKPPQVDPETGQPQSPPPPKDPMVEAEEIKAQTAMQLEPMKLQAQTAIEDKKTQNNMQQAQMEAEMSARLEEYKINKQAELEQFKAEKQAELEKYKIDRQIEADILTAQIAAGAQVRAARKEETGEDPEDEEVIARKQQEEERVNRRDQISEQTANALIAMVQQLSRPKRIVRGPDGRAAGVE